MPNVLLGIDMIRFPETYQTKLKDRITLKGSYLTAYERIFYQTNSPDLSSLKVKLMLKSRTAL